jgi:hypothetical protein
MKRALRMIGVAVGSIGLAVASLLQMAQAGEDKVKICHKPGTADEKELLVPASAVKGHLGHGDQLGPCGSGDPGGGR